jgi:exonuclease-1
LKKAHSLVLKYRKIDRVLSILRLEKKELVSEGYCFEFKQAMSIFLHARVYDARKRALTFLTPLPKGFEESCGGCTDFLGPYP